MMIIGCDYHPAFQQIAFVDTATGDCGERRLEHREEAENFYRDLAAGGIKVRVGMEASGHARWFERLLAELQLRVVDRRCSCDPCEASTQAEDGSPGCAADSEIDAERSTFRRSGYRVGRIGICGNCCGTGTAWCRRAPGS